MQKGAFKNIQEPFQKKATQILLHCVALSRGGDQPQPRLRHVRVEPRVLCCDLLLALASTLHLAICGGCKVTRPRPKPLNADAARVANSGECNNEFSYILADAIGSGSSFLHPERWIYHTFVCTRLLSQSVPREWRSVAKAALLEPISNSDVPSDAVVDIFIQRSVPWHELWTIS
jgi:hypothetical protein